MFELFDPKADVEISEGTNLPHWFQRGVTYFITFRTKDSIPADVSKRWHAERAKWLRQHKVDPGNPQWREQLLQLPRAEQIQFHETFSRQFMENLDQGWGKCVLRQPALSKIVADCLLHFDSQRYHMGDFVVIENQSDYYC